MQANIFKTCRGNLFRQGLFVGFVIILLFCLSRGFFFAGAFSALGSLLTIPSLATSREKFYIRIPNRARIWILALISLIVWLSFDVEQNFQAGKLERDKEVALFTAFQNNRASLLLDLQHASSQAEKLDALDQAAEYAHISDKEFLDTFYRVKNETEITEEEEARSAFRRNRKNIIRQIRKKLQNEDYAGVIQDVERYEDFEDSELHKIGQLALEKQKLQTQKYLQAQIAENEIKIEAERLATNKQTLMNRQTSAWIYCQDFMEDYLKAPSTAEFPSDFEVKYDPSNMIIFVRSYVDAQNSFGAMIRTKFQCKMRYKSGERLPWELIEITSN